MPNTPKSNSRIEPSEIHFNNSGTNLREKMARAELARLHAAYGNPSLDASVARVMTGQPATIPTPAKNPLLAYSLRGSAEEFESRAKDTKPLLGDFVMAGQATVIYAPPNAGKTLLTLHLVMDAVNKGLIPADNVFYVNADDSSSGLATKMRLMDDIGAHTLVPGFSGFAPGHLIQLVLKTAQLDAARGTLVIIDTLKKFTQLMDKKLSSEFADACRQFVMRGGTIVALAHTTKNPNLDGKLRYGGTTDILEDFDAAYVLAPLSAKADAGEKVVQFEMIKRRADSPDVVAYAYAAEAGATYEEKLASVRVVNLDQLDGLKRVSQQVDDEAVIAVITRRIIENGGGGQMALAKATADECGVSQRAALNVLQRYTGSNPFEHLWMFKKGDRGTRLYEMLTPD